ncbi:MAG: VOC family protein [Solirubrobacteraceae bacterium]
MSPAPTIDELLLGEHPERWAELGFAVADGCCEIGGVRLRFLTGAGERGIRGWTLRDLPGVPIDGPVELDGLPTALSELPPRAPAPVHPNGVVAIDHVVAASPSLDRSVEALLRAGLDLRRMRDEPTPGGAPRQAFFRLGAEILELIQEPQDSVRSAGGEGHPAREDSIRRGVGEGHPARFWGLALRVEDLDETVRWLDPHVGEIRPAVQRGRRIASLRRAAGLAVPLAFMSAPPAT